MCLAIPMQVKSIEDDFAVVDSGGVSLRVGLALVEGVVPGDYLIVHAGYAIQVLSEEEARETLAIFERLEQSWSG